MWSYWIVATQSGVKQLQVVPSAGRWRTVMNGVGDGEHTFPLRDTLTALPRSTWQGLAQPWARTLVVCWDDTPVYAGVILKSKYERATGMLELTHSELRVIFSRRMSFMVPTFTPSGSFTLSSKSLRGLVRGVVAKGAISVPGDDWHIPVVLPADEGGSESRTWFTYNFDSIESMITELQDTDGGPDVHLSPRWSTSGTLEWVLRIGTPALTGVTVEWNATANSDALELVQTMDATKQVTGMFALGNGSEQDMKVGKSPNVGIPGSDIPNLDTTRPFKSVDNVTELNALALGELKAFREPTTQFSVSTLASGVLPALVVGSTIKVWVDGDEFMNDGWRTGYLLGMSGDTSEKIGLEIQ